MDEHHDKISPICQERYITDATKQPINTIEQGNKSTRGLKPVD